MGKPTPCLLVPMAAIGPSPSLVALPLDAFEHRTGVAAQQPTELQELDDVETAITVLHLRYERLGATQLFRQLVLRQACLISRIDQQGEKRPIGTFVD